MINLLGKTLALLFVGLSIMLMSFAAALYFNAVDFGWKVPRTVYVTSDQRKPGDNVAIPSLIDKREAGMRRVARLKGDALLRLGNAQATFVEVEPFLGDNHLRGEAILAQLEDGPGELKVKDVKFDELGYLTLEPGTSRQLGFPLLDEAVPAIKMSYASYLLQLKAIETRIAAVQKDTEDLLEAEAKITARMSGEMDKDGKQMKQGGAVVRPGWYYLLDVEAAAQTALKKEVEYIQPLWVKELVDAQGLVSRRAILLRRLNELGDKSYLSQSEFLKKLD